MKVLTFSFIGSVDGKKNYLKSYLLWLYKSKACLQILSRIQGLIDLWTASS